jgi:LysR family transcriptional regulator, transcriptional activator of the cysJI operon
VLYQYEELYFELGRLNNAFKGTLRVGASSTISQYLLPKVIADFHKRYPEIELYVYNGNSLEMEQKLVNTEIEVALVENDSSHSNITYRDLFDDEIVAVTGSLSIYGKLNSISLLDLQQIPIVLREKGSGTLEVIQKQLLKNNIKVDNLNVLVHLGSTESIKNFLTSFDGIALLSRQSIEKELQLKQVIELPLKGISFNRKFRIALRQGQETLSSKLFTEFLYKYNF